MRVTRLHALVSSVLLAGCLVLLHAMLASSSSSQFLHTPVTLLLACLVVVGELRPIVITRGDLRDEITVSSTFALALTLTGPLWLALAVQGASVALADVRSRKSAVKLSYNVAQYVLTLAAARAVFCLVSGDPVLSAAPLHLPQELPAALLAAATFFAVNNLLAGVVTAVALEVPVWTHLAGDVRFQLATSGVLLAFAPVVVVALQITIWAAPLLVMPIVAIHRSAALAADREHEALHDTLTRLPNRALLRLRANRILEEAARTHQRFAVLLVDLDHFKEINDTLGHQVGDDLLVEVSYRLQHGTRAEDTVARLGGDEFAVLAPNVLDAADALQVASRLLESLSQSFTVDGVRLDVQASVGIALYPEHGEDVDTLVRKADVALYEAKVERGGAALYEPRADVHSVERLALATELREGLANGELFLVYQPQVDAQSGRPIGVEALVRWRHPRHGVLTPDRFLSVAENTGLVAPMTLALLDQALEQVCLWRSAGLDLTVAVNLSVRHLTDLDLPPRVAALLQARDLPTSVLNLEVTETMIMSDPARAQTVLALLRQIGVGLAVDDYGTGYSSLAYLRRLSVDELKIDRSFVTNVANSEEDEIIVRSTIELGHRLGLRLVAEGVEDEQSAQLLRLWGCDRLQGYGISHPLTDVELLPWLLAASARSLLLRAPLPRTEKQEIPC